MYKQIKNLKDNYMLDGMPDKRALENFIECEMSENIRTLENELLGIKNGGGNPQMLDAIIGKSRFLMHNGYDKWAKMAILWLAEVKKG